MVALVDELGLALVLARDACALGAVVSVCLHLKLGKRGSSQTKSQAVAAFAPIALWLLVASCILTGAHLFWNEEAAYHTVVLRVQAAVQHASNKASSPVTAVFNACLGDALVHGYVQDLIVLLCGGLLAFHAFAGRATAEPVEAADAAASEAAASEAAEAESQEDPLAMAVASGSLLLFIGSLMYNNFEQHGAHMSALAAGLQTAAMVAQLRRGNTSASVDLFFLLQGLQGALSLAVWWRQHGSSSGGAAITTSAVVAAAFVLLSIVPVARAAMRHKLVAAAVVVVAVLAEVLPPETKLQGAAMASVASLLGVALAGGAQGLAALAMVVAVLSQVYSTPPGM